MTQHCIWWWDSSSEDLKRMEYPFFATTPGFTLTRSGGTYQMSHLGIKKVCLKNCSYWIGPRAQKKKKKKKNHFQKLLRKIWTYYERDFLKQNSLFVYLFVSFFLFTRVGWKGFPLFSTRHLLEPIDNQKCRSLCK